MTDFICPRCDQPGTRSKARTICTDCKALERKTAYQKHDYRTTKAIAMQGYSETSQQYLSRPLRSINA